MAALQTWTSVQDNSRRLQPGILVYRMSRNLKIHLIAFFSPFLEYLQKPKQLSTELNQMLSLVLSLLLPIGSTSSPSAHGVPHQIFPVPDTRVDTFLYLSVIFEHQRPQKVGQAVAAARWAVFSAVSPSLPRLAMQDGMANFSPAQLSWYTEPSRWRNCFAWSHLTSSPNAKFSKDPTYFWPI